MLRLVVMADTHLYHHDLEVPDGDVLIHAGDMTRSGTLEQLAEVADWLRAMPHRHKLVVAGNHDRALELEPEPARAVFDGLTYLQDESVTLEGVKFYGSPWQPAFHSWAFNVPRGPELARIWARIPDDTDVLITHGPPRGIGDRCGMEERAGCEDLRARVEQVAPRLHVFGHIHQDRGRWTLGPTTYVNATTDECMAPATVLAFPP